MRDAKPRVGEKTQRRPLGGNVKTEFAAILYGAKRAGKSTTCERVVDKLRAKGVDAVWVHGDKYTKQADPVLREEWRDVARVVVFENHSWIKMKKFFPDIDQMPATFYLQISDEEFLRRAHSSMTERCRTTDEALLKNKARKDGKGARRCKYIISNEAEMVKILMNSFQREIGAQAA